MSWCRNTKMKQFSSNSLSAVRFHDSVLRRFTRISHSSYTTFRQQAPQQYQAFLPDLRSQPSLVVYGLPYRISLPASPTCVMIFYSALLHTATELSFHQSQLSFLQGQYPQPTLGSSAHADSLLT